MRTVSLSRDGRKYKLIDFTDGDSIIYVDEIVARDDDDAVAQAAGVAQIKPASFKRLAPGAPIFQAKVNVPKAKK